MPNESMNPHETATASRLYPSTLKQQARRSLTLAADWAARNQIRDPGPPGMPTRGAFHITF